MIIKILRYCEVKRQLNTGIHILALPTVQPSSIAQLFPKELSGSSIETMDSNGNWINREIVKYQNNTFVISQAYLSIPPLTTLRLTLKRTITIDWHVTFSSNSGLALTKFNFEIGFNFNKALYLCQLSKLVYENESVINDTIKSNYDFDDSQYYSKNSHKNLLKNNFTALLLTFIRGKKSVIDLQFMYLQKLDKTTGKNIITIVFRGSQEPQDWMTNFTFKDIDFLKRGRVHKGFYQAFRLFIQTLNKQRNDDNNIPTSILDNVDTFNQTSKIILTGHSLGGALATIASCYLMEIGVNRENIDVYTFGSPPVATLDLCNYYKEKLDIYRLVNSNDVVPQLEKITNLFHIGKEILLPSNEGEIHACESYIDNIIDQVGLKNDSL